MAAATGSPVEAGLTPEGGWKLLAQVGDVLRNEPRSRATLAEVCRLVSEAIQADPGVAILLLKGTVVEDVAWHGGGDAPSEVTSLRGKAFESQPALWSAIRSGSGSVVIAPFEINGTERGALIAFSSEPNRFAESVVRPLEEVAVRLGLALEREGLIESIAGLEGGRWPAWRREDAIRALMHDVQTPLAVVYGMVEALTREEGERSADDLQNLYEAMFRQVVRLRHLVGQFLDYAGMEDGRPLAFKLEPTDVRVPVDVIARSFAHANEIHVAIPPDLPPAMVDGARLMQVLANLMSNGVKFSPPGSPIAIEARERGDEIELVVSDRGCGMSPEDLERAFDKHFRCGSAEGTPGHGLGLYVTREIVERQGGKITVTSRVGEGSRFTVGLPKAHPELHPKAAKGREMKGRN
jgi:signal transduction histidine kinase